MLRALKQRGFAVVSPPEDLTRIASSLITLEQCLEQHFAAPQAANESCNRDDEDNDSPVSLAAFSERSQLRYVPRRTDHPAMVSLLERAAATGNRVLSNIALWALGAIHDAEGTPQGGLHLLDVFWYPGAEGWSEHGRPGQPPPPCPAHEDVGLVTVIKDNVSGLELQDTDGTWMQLPSLQDDECVILAGRALSILTRGAVPACTHRVRRTQQRRTSLVFEVRLDAQGVSAQALLEAEAAHSLASEAEAKYSKASATLLFNTRPAGMCLCM